MTSLRCSWEKCTQEQVASLRCRCHSCSLKPQFPIWVLWLFMAAETCVSPPLPLFKDKFSLPCLACRNQIHEIPKAYQFLLFFLIRTSCRLGVLATYYGTTLLFFFSSNDLRMLALLWLTHQPLPVTSRIAKFQHVLAV